MVFYNCTNLNNPVNTTGILPYPPPTIEWINMYSNRFDISIKSYLKNTGDLEGYIIYISEDGSIISNLDNTDLNSLNNISNKSGFFTNINQAGNIVNQATFQTLFVSNLLLTNTNKLFLAVSVYGQNDFFASVHQHKGFFESPSVRSVPFHLRKTFNFTLNSISNSLTNSSLGFHNHSFFVTNTPGGLVGMTNQLYVSTTSNRVGAYLIFNVGTNAAIQSLGYQEHFNRLTTLPKAGFSSQSMPIVSNHVYAVKTGNIYFKLQVTNIAFTPNTGLTNQAIISGLVAFVPIENAFSF